MKSLIKAFAVFIALIAGACLLPSKACAQQGEVSFQLFYDDLSPYGMWVDYPSYGYVWIPDGGSGFTPYATNGHWVFTDDGWTWFSDYPWGWATFHYGRWDYDDVYGWFWVPDNMWGPAWVSWRHSPGYYGWAPLRPGISISVAFGRDYHEQNNRWVFVRDRDIARPDVSDRYLDRKNNVTIINNSTLIINSRKDDKRNATYITGPNRSDVQKATGATIKPATIQEYNQPGQRLTNGELQLYRPEVQRMRRNGKNPVPAKVMRLNEVKPVLQRNAGNSDRQLPTTNPPKRGQQAQPAVVHPPATRGREQQPRTVEPPRKPEPQQPRAVNPPAKNAREQQPRMMKPPKKVQPQQPRAVNPSGSKGRETKPQKPAAPDKNRKAEPSQSKDKQNEKDKGKQESGQ